MRKVLCAVCLGVAAAAAAAVTYVDQRNTAGPWTGETWQEAYQTVSEGITRAQTDDGDVWVAFLADGSTAYTENVDIPDGVCVYGGFEGVELNFGDRAGYEGTLQGDGTRSTVVLSGNATLDWFRVTNGADTYGGGVYVSPSSSATITNCYVFLNSATDAGGGIYVAGDSTALIQGCTIEENAAASGGGVYFEAAPPPKAYANQIIDCIFHINDAVGNSVAGGEGGGLMFLAPCDVFGCTFQSNRALGAPAGTDGGEGGGIYAGADCDISDDWGGYSPNTFSSNLAGPGLQADVDTNGGKGGAVYCAGGPTGIYIANNEFNGNDAKGGSGNWDDTLSGYGGAIYIADYAEVHGNGFISNAALSAVGRPNPVTGSGGYGGGVCCADNSYAYVHDNTFDGNTADYMGGGVACIFGSTALVQTNTFLTNAAEWGGGIALFESAATVDDNEIGPDNDSPSGGGGIAAVTSGDLRKQADNEVTLNYIHDNTSGMGGGVYIEGPMGGWESGPKIGEGDQVTGNTIEYNTASWNGGGIRVNSGTPNIEDNDIQYNDCPDGNGGGISTNGDTVINNNRILWNTAYWAGGGIDATSVAFEYYTPEITLNDIHHNSAGEGGGGAILNYADLGGALIDQNQIYDNTTSGPGGGICIEPWTAPLITANNIHDNQADLGGGGIQIRPEAYGEISGNTIQDNDSLVEGGGINIGSGYAPTKDETSSKQDVILIQSNDILSNDAPKGGGIHCAPFQAIYFGSEVHILDNTVQDNQADDGGGIYFDWGNEGILAEQNIITGNTAVADGGGVCISYTDPPGAKQDDVEGLNLVDNDITYNSATNGGGVYSETGPTYIDTFIELNDIEWNDATSGAGVYLALSDVQVKGNNINNNTATAGGGGVAVSYPDIVIEPEAKDLTGILIEENAISGNSGSEGGGVYCSVGEGGPPVLIDDNNVELNSADGGAGFYFVYGHALVTNNILTDNIATGCGGGAFFGWDCHPEFHNNDLYANTASDSCGGGVFIEEAPPPKTNGGPSVVNNIITDSSGDGATIQAGAAGTFAHNDVWNNASLDYTFADLTGMAGNISDDPDYLNAGLGDYHISGGSPCRDVGDSTVALPALDYDDEPRVAGIVDIGADEVQGYISPAGWFKDGWNLISVPVDPFDPEASAVFDDLVAAGNVINTNLFNYSQATGYLMYSTGFTAVERKRAYWLRLTVAGQETLTGTEDTADPMTIPLDNGWNMIGHPHPEAVAWADCSITDGATTLSIADASAAGWLQATGYYYEIGYFEITPASGDLTAWYGYWILTYTDGLTLLVPQP